MEHEGHRQRMRERFLKQGLEGFAPHEVLELILFYAIPQKNVNPIAHELIERFGSLHGVLEASIDQLRMTPGIGDYSAALISLFSQVASRMDESRAGMREKLKNRQAAEKHCLRLLSACKRENFFVVCLNAQMELLGDRLISQGSIAQVPAYPRVVAEAVLSLNAHAALLCHNHPGGSLFPSQADMDATVSIARLLSEIEVELADHIIVADGKAFSMVRYGLIERSVSDIGMTTQVADSAGTIRIKRELEDRGIIPKTINTEEP